MMKQTFSRLFLLVFASLLSPSDAFSQYNVKITVNSGSATTTCTDPFSAPDPMWSVNINNGGWVNYPSGGGCFQSLPNIQFNQTYTCLSEVPATIEVCFRAFENDPNVLIACDVATSCLAEVCLNVPVPAQGSQGFNVALPNGSADLTITSSGFPGGYNDLPCDAINFGVLLNNTRYGSADTSFFNNYCATNVNEPEPSDYGTNWINTHAVWFSFTTNSDPGPYIQVLAKSDPSALGDPVNLQLAIFTTDDNTCTGAYSMVLQNHNPADWDENLLLVCPPPNKTYFVMVDAVSDTPEMAEGIFGIEVNTLDVERGGDLRCDAQSLGTIPLGGNVTSGWRTNSCASGTDDPPVAAFPLQKTVWFSFNPSPTGHVLIDAIADTNYDPIGLQLVAFTSSNGTCTGNLVEIQSAYNPATNGESIELHCLGPNQTIFVLVDGADGLLTSGIFRLSVSDAGDETARATLDTALCFGGSLAVGTSVYTQAGTYVDTLQTVSGCDSIITSNVSLLTAVEVNLSIVQQGLGVGNTAGIALSTPTGGAGGYGFVWSNGQTTAQGTNLIGGDVHCVTVSDQQGCTADTCFEMPFYLHFEPRIVADTLDCFGDSDGQILFTAEFGLPPYQYSWQKDDNSLNGSGAISTDGEWVALKDLPAGIYSIQMVDVFFDTTLLVGVIQPTAVAIGNSIVSDASCFGACDGSVQVVGAGGTPGYQFAWSNGDNTSAPAGLCLGAYQVTVSDANGCTNAFAYQVNQPAQFTATATETKGVSCFMGNDGEANVGTNGTPGSYVWSNGDTLASIAGLAGGSYSVTVTNTDGCTATSSVSVSTPAAPVGVAIQKMEPVICYGDRNGSLGTTVTGPGTSFSYLWSNGAYEASAYRIGAGNYSVTVTNQLGCTATASFTLDEPSPIQVAASSNQITCDVELDGGIITVDNVTGGVGPYLFSKDGDSFSADDELLGYTAGPQSFYILDAGGCEQQFSHTIEGRTELLAHAGENQKVQLGDLADLIGVSNQSNVTFQWAPAEWLDCPDCPNTAARPIGTTEFKLVVTDGFGCTATDEITVEVIKKRRVFIPNAFSPNGDGFNDEFVLFGGTDVVAIKEFKVFDRQGNMVHAASNFQPADINNAWNGAFRGKVMQPGVFVWFAEIEFLDKAVEMFTGDVVLMR